MKKIVLSLFLGLMLIGVMGFVVAQEDDTAICDPENLDLCTGQNECESFGGEWDDGICSVGTERVTCEIDYGTDLDEEVVCNVEYNGVSASCTFEAHGDTVCYPEPAINIGKPTPDEGFMPVPGLSGTFENIDCDEIETVYNTNGFFVGCKISENETDDDYGERRREGLGQMIRGRVRAGVYTNEAGDQIRVRELAQNRFEFTFGNHSARTELEVEEETEGNRTKFKIKLNNGRNAEIKIMPNVASATALARLRLKNCNESRNCSIELKEVGQGNKSRLVYEAKARKTFRIWGFIKNHEEVRTRIDAETGEEIDVKRPWWAWMASEDDEADENEAEE